MPKCGGERFLDLSGHIYFVFNDICVPLGAAECCSCDKIKHCLGSLAYAASLLVGKRGTAEHRLTTGLILQKHTVGRDGRFAFLSSVHCKKTHGCCRGCWPL